MRKFFSIPFILLLVTSPAFAAKLGQSELVGKGYLGTLPNLSKQYSADEPEIAKPIFEKTKNFHSSNEIKPAPRDNPAFVNIILKTDKTSAYANDINEIIPMFEKVLLSIEDEENVQKFVSKVYFLNKNVEYLNDKYNGKSESQFISFRKMTQASTHCKSVALLRSEAEKYSPYLAYSGSGHVYNKNNITEQLGYLRTEIEQTITVLKEVN